MINLDNMYKDSDWRDDPNAPDDFTILIDGNHGWFNALFSTAGGTDPKPTVLLLHGFPGNEKNLDMMQALRRCGFNVLTFNYSGSWGSPGPFLFANVLDDTKTALQFVKDNAEEYHVDLNNIFMVGHSMGGFSTLHNTAVCEGLKGSIAMAPYDFGRQYKLGKENGGDDWTNIHELIEGGVLQLLTDYDTLMKELEDHPEYNIDTIAETLAKKPLMIIGAEFDICAVTKNHGEYLADCIKKFDPADFEYQSIPSSHSFVDKRLALCEMVAKKLTSWVD